MLPNVIPRVEAGGPHDISTARDRSICCLQSFGVEVHSEVSRKMNRNGQNTMKKKVEDVCGRQAATVDSRPSFPCCFIG